MEGFKCFSRVEIHFRFSLSFPYSHLVRVTTRSCSLWFLPIKIHGYNVALFYGLFLVLRVCSIRCTDPLVASQCFWWKHCGHWLVLVIHSSTVELRRYDFSNAIILSFLFFYPRSTNPHHTSVPLFIIPRHVWDLFPTNDSLFLSVFLCLLYSSDNFSAVQTVEPLLLKYCSPQLYLVLLSVCMQ